MKKKYANFRHVKVVQILKIEVNEGDGTPGDPVCRVTYLCSMDGKLLAKIGEVEERLFAGEDEMRPL